MKTDCVHYAWKIKSMLNISSLFQKNQIIRIIHIGYLTKVWTKEYLDQQIWSIDNTTNRWLPIWYKSPKNGFHVGNIRDIEQPFHMMRNGKPLPFSTYVVRFVIVNTFVMAMVVQLRPWAMEVVIAIFLSLQDITTWLSPKNTQC